MTGVNNFSQTNSVVDNILVESFFHQFFLVSTIIVSVFVVQKPCYFFLSFFQTKLEQATGFLLKAINFAKTNKRYVVLAHCHK